MAVSKQFLDELKARLRVSEVVGRKVKLTRRGREFVGLSPFSNEKTPSFTVNDDKQFWHCFSSGEHGDVISFLEKTENLSFMEAVERLASEAGLEVPRADPRERERERKQASLIDVMEMAADFFQRQLGGGGGGEARAYLTKRGLSEATIRAFRLGYAPGTRTALYEYLEARDVTRAQMRDAGLIIDGEEIRAPYDRFRHRIMFPIEDARGRVIAFGGRALDPDAPAKYLNSPETELFHKGRTLFNLARARKPAYDAKTVLVVEGYMDVIALAQAGFENAVAPLGTALTADQIGLLWRLAPEPVLCFDGDKAGTRAAFRATERALPLLKPGHSLRFAFLPEGQDPDDLVRTQGATAMQATIDAAKPLVDLVWEKEMSASDLDTPERRADFEARLDARLAEIEDQKVRYYYRQAFRDKQSEMFAQRRAQARQQPASRTGMARSQGYAPRRFGDARRPGERWGGRSGSRDAGFMPTVSPELRAKATQSDPRAALRPRALTLLAVMLRTPHVMLEHLDEIAEIDLGLDDLEAMKRALIDRVAALSDTDPALDATQVCDHLRACGFTAQVEECRLRLGLKDEQTAIEDAAETGTPYRSPERLLMDLMAEHRRSFELERELAAARRALEQEMTDANLARLQAILAEYNRSDRHDEVAENNRL